MESITKVYRLEHPTTGVGPYQMYSDYIGTENADLIETMGFLHSLDGEHPGRLSDDLNFLRNFICACPTIDSLYKWFGDFMKPLLDMGFEIVEIMIDSRDIIMGKSHKQCSIPVEAIRDKKNVTQELMFA